MFVPKSTQFCLDQSEQLVSTYHPDGMLDRDQRTAKSLPDFPKMGGETYSLQKFGQSKSKYCCSPLHSSQSCKQHRPRQNQSVLLIYSCSNNNNNNAHCNNGKQSEISRTNNNNFIYYQLSPPNREHNQMHHATKCRRLSQPDNEHPNFHNRSTLKPKSSTSSSPASCPKSTKLSNLLICICFWFLILQKTRAMPVTQSCETYKSAIKVILDQAKMSYSDNLRAFDNFTKKYLQEGHEKSFETWKHTKIESLKPKSTTSRQKELEFYDKSDIETIAHLKDGFTMKMVREELKELYERLMILEYAFDFIIDRDNAIDDYDHKYYLSHRNYLRMLMNETKDGLDKFQIEKPHLNIPNLAEHSKEIRDYIIMREHLIVLRYIRDAYEILLSCCPANN